MTLLVVTLALVRLLGALVFIDFALGPQKHLRYPVIATGWFIYAASPIFRILAALPDDLFSAAYGLTATIGVLVVSSGTLAYKHCYPLRNVLIAAGAILLATLALRITADDQALFYFYALAQFGILIGLFSSIFFDFRTFFAIGGRSYYWAAAVMAIGALHALAYPAFYSTYPDIPLPFAVTTVLSVMIIIFFIHLEHTISLREKEGLLAEVHHRVRNNLQLIESLLHLEGVYRNPAEYETLIEDVYRKIHSMSLIHELVYEEGSYGSFDLSLYARRLSDEISEVGERERERKITCHVSGEPLFVSMERMIPMGMVLQEALENAAIHGAAEQRELEIRVDIWESAKGTGRIRVADNGPGFPEGFDPRSTETLGYTLINQLVQQVQGSYEIRGNHGASIFVEFPL